MASASAFAFASAAAFASAVAFEMPHKSVFQVGYPEVRFREVKFSGKLVSFHL